MSRWSAAGPISSSRGTVCGEAGQLTQMFSGIVSEMGVVTANGSGRLAVESRAVSGSLHTGDSVAVNGVCLTVVDLPDGAFVADVMPETERRTTLGSLRPGDTVNLEASLALGDDRRRPGARAADRREGLRRRRRHQPHRGRCAARIVHRVADPAHARAHDRQKLVRRFTRQHRGRPGGSLRAARTRRS